MSAAKRWKDKVPCFKASPGPRPGSSAVLVTIEPRYLCGSHFTTTCQKVVVPVNGILLENASLSKESGENTWQDLFRIQGDRKRA